ncbi:NAD-dependent epimerase/dehydratase family protein [Propionibacteriaceae bacterium Y2011]|uniref:NAD-dependent epimerase/dehydratase family protein n=1 Tax=Microlunatus sp. Y2014 TaxID=3418488 RepID=UPI003B48235C
MRIVIVGGAGVLATQISPYLQQAGHQVVALGPDAPTVAGVEHVPGDATDFDVLRRGFAGADAVVNFALRAARGAGADEQTDPVRAAFAVNVGSVYAQLRVAAAEGVAAFVQMSTLAVYEGFGQQRRSALEPTDGTSLYGVTKRMAELAAESEAARTPELTVTTLRMGYPTRAEWWPRWGNPVVTEPGPVPSFDGSSYAAVHPEDLAEVILLAAARRGPYVAAPVTADLDGAALADQWPHVLGWRPRHVLGEIPEPAR